MKKIIITALFFATTSIYAQLVVSDPGVETAMAQSIAMSQQQLTKTENLINKQEEQIRVLKQMKEKVERVNGVLRDMQELRDILKMQKESIKIATSVKGRLSEFSTAEFQKNALNTISVCLNNLTNTLVFIQKLTSNNFFSMTDKERIDLVREQKSQAFRAYILIKKYAK
ncbi:hypothetical protein C8D70_12310 [Chryseobacterium sp. CBTAP 102]|uniref:hypothetical protein n=1 Tax=Chryseobacterium sp. CBTAP 102 TaxID=2135644 RepID=UPI000D76FC17|nr:hypothetical protein [Chryseobacterium sp. CBTAP 102]PXW07095.1 hypothetical protein C8D70_12310 [Chryseobacterium sp. CBTAP 102]